MWFKTGAARVGDGACVRVRPVVSGVGPSVSGLVQLQAGSANQLVFLNTPNLFKSHEISQKVMKSREIS